MVNDDLSSIVNGKDDIPYITRWCPQDSVQLVNITPISLWFMVLITIVNGVYKPTYNWGAPPCIYI